MQQAVRLGIFTTDEHLVVRSWDRWMADATGIEPSRAVDRPLVEVIPEITARGTVDRLQGVLTRGTVEVLAPALHHYLFACAPAEPSTSFDRMQQHVTIGPLRDEHRIVGLIVTVEDVTDRVAQERRAAASPQQSQDIESLTHRLGDEDWKDRRSAVAALAKHGSAAVDSLARTLSYQHDNLNVLSSALDLLAFSDIDVIDPLVRFLDDDNANLRTQAALILGARRDRRAIAPLIAHLADPDVNVRFHIIEALGRLHATEACEHLVAIAEQRDFFLAFPALHALTRLGTPAVAPRLVPLLTDELLRAGVIEALGELGDEDVIVPLVRLLDSSSAPTEVITDALAGLYDRYESRYGAGDHIAALVRRSVSAAGTQRILDAVQRVGTDRLPGLARVLGWLEGDAVQRALARLLGKDVVRSQVVEALVRNGRGVVDILAEQLRAEDLETRQAAAVALGRIGDRRATAPLVAALGEEELAVAAAGALARIGDADAFDALIGLLGSPDPAIRQAAIAALNSIGHADMPAHIVRLLGDPAPIIREAALKIAGYFGYPASVDGVLACSQDDAESVRRTAVEQLALFDDRRAFERLVGALDDELASVRAAAAGGLALVEHPDRGQVLVRALEDPDAWVRYVALKSLATVPAPAVWPAVMDRLNHDAAPHVRLAAVEVVGRLAPPEALGILEPLTNSANRDIACAAIGALAHVADPAALAVLEREMRAEETWRRLVAVEAMSGRSDARLPEVLQWIAAADADVSVANAAVAGLTRVAVKGGTEGAEATRALMALSKEPSRREAVISALSTLPARCIGDIASGLSNPSPAVRCAVVEALSRMRQPDASRAVEDALQDATAQVRLAAVGELKHLGTRTSQKRLMDLARTDPDAEVRHAAMNAIARAETPIATAGDTRR